MGFTRKANFAMRRKALLDAFAEEEAQVMAVLADPPSQQNVTRPMTHPVTHPVPSPYRVVGPAL